MTREVSVMKVSGNDSIDDQEHKTDFFAEEKTCEYGFSFSQVYSPYHYIIPLTLRHSSMSSTSEIILALSASNNLYWPSRETFSGPVLAYFLMKSVSISLSITLNSSDVPQAARAIGRSGESFR